MAAEAIGLGFDEGWAAAASGAVNGRGNRVVDRNHVLTVNHDSRYPVADCAIRDVLHGRRFGSRDRDSVRVILTQPDHGKFPQRGGVRSLVEGTAVGGPFTEKAHTDLIGSAVLRREGCPSSYWKCAAQCSALSQDTNLRPGYMDDTCS